MIRALLLLVCLAAPASAQQCAPHADVVAGLERNYGETRQASGMDGNASLMELFASERTGTWTLTITTPDGMTCLVGSGEGYADAAPNA